MLSFFSNLFILAPFLVLGDTTPISKNTKMTSEVPGMLDLKHVSDINENIRDKRQHLQLLPGIVIGSVSTGCYGVPTMYKNVSEIEAERDRTEEEHSNKIEKKSASDENFRFEESHSEFSREKRQLGKDVATFRQEMPNGNEPENLKENDFKEKISQVTENRVTDGNSTTTLEDLHENIKYNFTDIPWPIVPGPISCDPDYPLQPSFVAKLGEFDFVVSVQRQESPEEPAEHTCTGVIYNRRFVIVPSHCLNDNYGLMVTSTDDLCTIDETIEVDYIIEHKDYDSETRHNDIALLKLKSEIHKRSVEFPSQDDPLGSYFYAVGFGELLWRSFPDKVSKLLQKVPVEKYTQELKEEPGTLLVTTSPMDLTGVLRGDFGGALVNHRGEFIGLKSKFVKRAMEYEIYTKVQDYLPWIKAMVALHGT